MTSSCGDVPTWLPAAAEMSSILPLRLITQLLDLGIWLKTLLLSNALQKVSGDTGSYISLWKNSY